MKVIGYQIRSVSGPVVRKRWTDWIGGSHHLVDRFIPPDEIWIERELGTIEGRFILAHELIEAVLMRRLGWRYDKAHQAATELEHDLRNRGHAASIWLRHLDRDLPHLTTEILAAKLHQGARSYRAWRDRRTG